MPWLGRWRRIEEKLDRILSNQEIFMSQYTDLVSALDAETTAIAARIDALTASVAAAVAAGQAPDLTPLQAISDRLKSLGTDPAAPIPAPAPAP